MDRSRREAHDQRLRDKQQLLEIYGPICHICRYAIDLTVTWPHKWSFTRDHLLPIGLGGDGDIDNLRPAHKYCNQRRGNASPEELNALRVTLRAEMRESGVV